MRFSYQGILLLYLIVEVSAISLCINHFIGLSFFYEYQ